MMEKLTREQVVELMIGEDEFFILKFMTYASALEMMNEEAIELLTNIAIEKSNAKLLLNIATMVDGINVEKMEDALISIGDIGCLRDFANNVEGADIERIKRRISEIHCFSRKGKK